MLTSTLKWGVSARGGVELLYKYFLNHTSIWCLKKDIQQCLKVVLLISISMQNIEKPNISENQQMRNPLLTLTIHGNKLSGNDFKTWTLCNNKSRQRQCSFGSDCCFQCLGFTDLSHQTKKKKKSQKLKSIFSIFWSYSKFLSTFLMLLQNLVT